MPICFSISSWVPPECFLQHFIYYTLGAGFSYTMWRIINSDTKLHQTKAFIYESLFLFRDLCLSFEVLEQFDFLQVRELHIRLLIHCTVHDHNFAALLQTDNLTMIQRSTSHSNWTMTQITQPPHLKEAVDSDVRQNLMLVTSCSSLKQINLIKTSRKLKSVQLHVYTLSQIL